MSGATTNRPGAGAPSSADKSAQKAPASIAQNEVGGAASSIPVSTSLTATPIAQAMVKCPKCGASVREVARFCQKCHHTMRYECPSCHHQQRTGGQCKKCGVDFLKYIGAVMSQKQAEQNAIHERFEIRSTFMKNLLYLPFTLGFPIIRDYFLKRDRTK